MNFLADMGVSMTTGFSASWLQDHTFVSRDLYECPIPVTVYRLRRLPIGP